MSPKKKKRKGTVRERKINFLKLFPNMAITRKGEKRIPLLQCCQNDP
jgi:hypothetical protein